MSTSIPKLHKRKKPSHESENGRERYAVVDIEDWEMREAARELVSELNRDRASATGGTRTLEEARTHLTQLMESVHDE